MLLFYSLCWPNDDGVLHHTANVDQCKNVCAILVGFLWKLEITVVNITITLASMTHAKRLPCCIVNAGSHLLGIGLFRDNIMLFLNKCKGSPIGCGEELGWWCHKLHLIYSLRKYNMFSCYPWLSILLCSLSSRAAAQYRTPKPVAITLVAVPTTMIFHRNPTGVAHTYSQCSKLDQGNNVNISIPKL